MQILKLGLDAGGYTSSVLPGTPSVSEPDSVGEYSLVMCIYSLHIFGKKVSLTLNPDIKSVCIQAKSMLNDVHHSYDLLAKSRFIST